MHKNYILGFVFFLICSNFVFAQGSLHASAWEKAENRVPLTDKECHEVAERIHREYIIFDSHNDTALWTNNPNGEYTVKKGQCSFDYMKKGGVDGAFFALYLEQAERDDKSLDSVYSFITEQIKLFKKNVEKNEDVSVAYSVKDVLRLKNEEKKFVVFAVENSYAIGKDISKIDSLYELGVRYITLSHNSDNDICDAAVSNTNSYNGLSKLGVKAIKRMNEIGMIIDVSHASTKTLKDVTRISKYPIIASHSAVKAICNNKRNLTDKEIKLIAKKGGVIQIAAVSFFLSNLPDKNITIKHLADHIDYVKNLVGADHIGLGTDFDGGGGIVGMDNYSEVKNLTAELLKRGYTPKEIQKFWGGNLLRVWEQVSKNKN